jgi:hypothetical protein
VIKGCDCFEEAQESRLFANDNAAYHSVLPSLTTLLARAPAAIIGVGICHFFSRSNRPAVIPIEIKGQGEISDANLASKSS